MTKRDFFMLIIKLFGLFAIINTLFDFILMIFSFPESLLKVWYFAITGMIIGLYLLLVFASDKIIQLLKLDKGFDEERIEMGNYSAVDVVKIGSFIIGGLLIIKNITQFLIETKNALFADTIESGTIDFSNKSWIISGLNILVGFFLITKYNYMVKIFIKEPVIEEVIGNETDQE